MDSQQKELLQKLYNFYKKRYTSVSEFESKFNSAIADLIDTGDIEKKEYLNFCLDNDIEPMTKKKGKISNFKGFPSPSDDVEDEPDDSDYGSSGCGGGGNRGYNKSHC